MKKIASQATEYLSACEQNGRFSGSVLIALKEDIILSRGFGWANVQHRIPSIPATRFRIGSLTKPFTSMALLLLHQQNLLNVENTVSCYVPGYPQGDRITLYHLLTHSSGIPDFMSCQIDKTKRYTSEDMVGIIAQMPLESAPGQTFRYSNAGYSLLGYIIEKVSGVSYGEFLKLNIFLPLQMKNSTAFGFSGEISHAATGYTMDGSKLIEADYRDLSTVIGCGGVISTVEDLYLWHRSLSECALLDRSLTEKMFTPFKENYACGWHISELFQRRLVWHNGATEGFKAGMYRFTDDDACIILLSNLEHAWEAEISRDLAAILFGKPYQFPCRHDFIHSDPRAYDDYVGQYQFSAQFIAEVIRKEDQLLLQIPNQPRCEIFPGGQDLFWMKVSSAEMTFIRSSEGNVKYLMLHQDGQHYLGRRIKGIGEP